MSIEESRELVVRSEIEEDVELRGRRFEPVLLGFFEPQLHPNSLHRRFFPSKAGGQPVSIFLYFDSFLCI